MSNTKTKYAVIATHAVANPSTTALKFSALLGADRGVPSTIITISTRTVDVLADDGRAIRFTKAR